MLPPATYMHGFAPRAHGRERPSPARARRPSRRLALSMPEGRDLLRPSCRAIARTQSRTPQARTLSLSQTRIRGGIAATQHSHPLDVTCALRPRSMYVALFGLAVLNRLLPDLIWDPLAEERKA